MPELDTLTTLFDDANLQALFRFQGNAKDMKGTNNGTLNGSPSFVTGKYGKAIELTGSSTKYVDLGNVLNITGNFSVAAWIKPTALGDVFIYAKDVSGSRGFGFGITSSGEISSEKEGTPLLNSTSAGIPVGLWTHIAQVYDGTNWKQYRNGVEVGSVAGTAIPSSTASVMIGRRAYVGAEQPFNGLVDDLNVWNRALTAAEVLTIFKDTGSKLVNYRPRKRTPGLVSV